jgi:hypothetical protein
VAGISSKKSAAVGDGVGGKAGMQVLEDLAVAAPAAEGQIAGTDQHVAFVRCREHGQLRMKQAVRHGHGLEFVILADPLRSLFAQARTHALNIRQNERLRSAAANQPVEDDGFEK